MSSSSRHPSPDIDLQTGSTQSQCCIQNCYSFIYKNTQRRTRNRLRDQTYRAGPGPGPGPGGLQAVGGALWRVGVATQLRDVTMLLTHISHHASGEEEVADGGGEQAAPAGRRQTSSAAPEGQRLRPLCAVNPAPSVL